MEELLEQLEKLKLMEQMCSHWDNTGMKLVSVVNFVVFFVLPLAVTIFCYIKILHKINNMSNMGQLILYSLIIQKNNSVGGFF